MVMPKSMQKCTPVAQRDRICARHDARPLGVVDIVYAARGDVVDARACRGGRRVRAHRSDARHRSRDARAAGRLPDRVPEAGRHVVRDAGARCDRDGMWERAVRWWRAAPHALLEPWAGAVVNSTRDGRRVPRARCPALRLLVDTGHVADWGERPVRAARPRRPRAAPPGRAAATRRCTSTTRRGVVDFARRAPPARRSSTTAASSRVEYFDLPDNGWPLDDPEQWARDLAGHVRALMR